MRSTNCALRLCAVVLLTSLCGWAQDPRQGTLHSTNSKGVALADCPLQHTAVKADIAGMIARVSVEQQFHNPYNETIEAVYVFPLPADSAVDSMVMTVGGRLIKGKIKARDEAQALYDAARKAGQVASLLHQERPNIFTQSIANVLPGENVTITISYLQMLPYDEGEYEFRFPMVVGPRYVPAPGNRVPDASRITPPVMPEGTRAGHDISLEVAIDAGIPIGNPASKSHDVVVIWRGSSSAVVKLKDEATIPNKDFILRYNLAGRTIQDTLLTHRTAKGGYFALILQPPQKFNFTDTAPKELIFVLDTSGSMSGFPIEKAKEAMKLAMNGLYPQDTFNLITFSGDTSILFPQPVPATTENVAMAQLFLQGRSGSGGTEMMKAIQAALEPSGEPGRVRIVCFMTDGFVGNDLEILAEIQKHPTRECSPSASAVPSTISYSTEWRSTGAATCSTSGCRTTVRRRPADSTIGSRNPLLTDISIDWGELGVTDVYPKRIPDLYGSKPVVVTGRFSRPGSGAVQLHGRMAGIDTARRIDVNLPASQPEHDAIATLWARARVTDLLGSDMAGAQHGNMSAEVRKEITQVGLDYQIATQFTSFIAVEERAVNAGGLSRRVEVPVNLPEGVSNQDRFRNVGVGSGGGIGNGMGGGSSYFSGANSQYGGMMQGSVGYVPAGTIAPPKPVLSKLAPALATRIESGATDDVKVQILLSNASPATIERLKLVGLEIVKLPGKDLMVVGTIAIGKLARSLFSTWCALSWSSADSSSLYRSSAIVAR